MADFDSVRQTIDASIKQNGTGAITGPVLNGVLNKIVDAADDQVSQLGREAVGVDVLSVSDSWQHGAIQSSLFISSNENYRISPTIKLSKGDIVTVKTSGSNPLWTIVKCREDGTLNTGLVALNGDNDTIATYIYQATEDIYIRVAVRIVLTGYSVTIQRQGALNAVNNKLIHLVGFGSSSVAGGVTRQGDIFYNTRTKLLRQRVGEGDTSSDYVTIPFYDGAIYIYNGNLYTWNGTDMVQTPASFEGMVDTSEWANQLMSDNVVNISISNSEYYRLSPVISLKKDSVVYVNSSAGSARICLLASCDSAGNNLRPIISTDDDVSTRENKLYRFEATEDIYVRVGYRYVLDGAFVAILKTEDNLLFAETKVAPSRHLRILLMGNSYTSDAWGYVPFILKQYGITCEIYMYWRGALSLDDLVRFWESADRFDSTSPQAAEGAYRFLFHINTRYRDKWEELSRMSAKDLVALGGWDIIQLQQWGRYSMDNSHTNPYFEQIMSLIRASYSGPFTLAWEMAWLRVIDLSQANKNANLSVAGIINKEHCADIVFPCATTVFNCQENPTLAAIGDSEYHNLYSFDNVHLEEGLPVYAVGCSIAEVLLRRYFPVASILGNTLRPTADDISSWNIPQAQLPQSGVITSITDDNCYLVQKAAIIASKYPYEINGV